MSRHRPNNDHAVVFVVAWSLRTTSMRTSVGYGIEGVLALHPWHPPAVLTPALHEEFSTYRISKSYYLLFGLYFIGLVSKSIYLTGTSVVLTYVQSMVYTTWYSTSHHLYHVHDTRTMQESRADRTKVCSKLNYLRYWSNVYRIPENAIANNVLQSGAECY